MNETNIFNAILHFIRKKFNSEEAFIPLHKPCFIGNECSYVLDAIESTYVSSVGGYVDKFENMIAEIAGSSYAIAIVNGTSALHVALRLAGVQRGDEVIIQPLTFVATTNAIRYRGAYPVFTDIDTDTLGMSPEKLANFLDEKAKYTDGQWFNKDTGNRIAACVPMHTFGLPMRIDELLVVCNEYDIPIIEDAAESLGSSFQNNHTGTFGKMGIFSFNGNKTITSGGGGAIVTDDILLAEKAKHITTTAKVNHRWEYVHDEVGYNYRMPNLNAALACAQLEMLEIFVKNKRSLAKQYHNFFSKLGLRHVQELEDAKSNYWLNAIIMADKNQRDNFLAYSNDRSVMTRPAWKLLNRLPMYEDCCSANLDNAEWLVDRIVNIPSSVRISNE